MTRCNEYYVGLELADDIPVTDFCKLIADKRLVGFRIIVDPLCDDNEMLTDEQIFLIITEFNLVGSSATVLVQTSGRLPEGFFRAW